MNDIQRIPLVPMPVDIDDGSFPEIARARAHAKFHRLQDGWDNETPNLRVRKLRSCKP